MKKHKCIKSLWKEINQEDFIGLLNWLHEIPNLSEEIIIKLPCFSDGTQTFSFEELGDNYIILTEKTSASKSILKRLGFSVYDNICPVDFNFNLPKEKETFAKIYKHITDQPNIITSRQKLALFNLFLTFEGVGEGTCSGIRLFQNVCGDLKPLNEMLAYRDDAPTWLHPYMICKKENFKGIEKYLIDPELEYQNVISRNIDSIKVPPLEIIQNYSLEGKEIRKFLNRCKTNEELSQLLPAIIGESKETKSHFLNSIPKLILSENKHYDKNTFESIVIRLALESLNDIEIEQFASKIYYGDTCIRDFSINDEVCCEYEVQGVTKTVVFSLSKLLPEYENISSGIAKTKGLFEEEIPDKLFAFQPKNKGDIADEIKKLLNISSGTWDVGIGSAEQYLFLTYYYRHECRYSSSWVMYITLEDQPQDFVSNLMDCMFYNKIDIVSSPFTYRFNSQICNKYFNNQYVFEDECIPVKVEKWADSEEKKLYLKSNNVKTEDSKLVRLRKGFINNEKLDCVKEDFSVDLLKKVLDFSISKSSDFDGDNQKAFLLWIFKNRVNCLSSIISGETTIY